MWQLAIVFGPVAAFVFPLLVASALGSFDDFSLVGKPVTFAQSLSILGALCFPWGIFLVARRGWNLARIRASQSWPAVPGSVQRSEVQRRITGLPIVLWKLQLSYSYQVAGLTYRGDRVKFGPTYVRSRALVEGLAVKYRPGNTVTVRYDPHDPATAVIEMSDDAARQNEWQIWIYFLAPVVISGFVAMKN